MKTNSNCNVRDEKINQTSDFYVLDSEVISETSPEFMKLIIRRLVWFVVISVRTYAKI